MNELIKRDGIAGKIYQIRDVQVMLDRDLAELYQVETKVLNQAVKRNASRFPPAFMFQLSDREFLDWRSQIVTSNSDKMGLRRSPYAFTEQGVAMLSAVLRSKTAVDVSVQIMQAFVAMRRFMLSNAEMFRRIDSLEIRQLQTEKKVGQVLDAIGSQELEPKQGVFFNGQIFDAYSFVSKLVRKAKSSLFLRLKRTRSASLSGFQRLEESGRNFPPETNVERGRSMATAMKRSAMAMFGKTPE